MADMDAMTYIPVLEYEGMRSALKLIHRLLHDKKYEDAQLVACTATLAMDIADGKVPKEAVDEITAALITDLAIAKAKHGGTPS